MHKVGQLRALLEVLRAESNPERLLEGLLKAHLESHEFAPLLGSPLDYPAPHPQFPLDGFDYPANHQSNFHDLPFPPLRR